MKDFKIITLKIPDFDKLDANVVAKTGSEQFPIKEIAFKSPEEKTGFEKFLIKLGGIVIILIVSLLFSMLNSFFV